MGAEMERYTRNTLTCVEELRLQLCRIVENGYAVDDEELNEDVRGVAAPIRNYAGQVLGAVVITGPSFRVTVG
jgi:DNA-binding IclR family transcriptional regulator